MQLYLIRHAHAIAAVNDAERPLSAKGRAQVKRLARFLRTGDRFAPTEIWHSPLVRAAETAKLLARGLQSDVPPREAADIAPEDDPHNLARRLARAPESLAIVGHEPHLSALASLLVAGKASPPVFELKKGSVLALEGAKGRWVVRWQLSAELLGGKK
jgi:phosphohistidine phosphatase